ncbi:MAG: HNH/ENDO VII family nuclease [Candidatus Cloacimonetes bacterium]|nr:HNH/ENDO VII family nuclease [Candidatus Cloacimonadota bacterium]
MFEQLGAIAAKGLDPIDVVLKEIPRNFSELSPVKASMETIGNTSLEGLKAQNEHQIAGAKAFELSRVEFDERNTKGLTESEKQQIANETGWSDSIIDQLSSRQEADIYKSAELQDVMINGKNSLVKADIDWNQQDSMLRTNKERAELGLSPINESGDSIELHHIGQKNDGSLAELTPDEHRGKENYSILHDTHKASEIDRVKFNFERSDYWKARASLGGLNA